MKHLIPNEQTIRKSLEKIFGKDSKATTVLGVIGATLLLFILFPQVLGLFYIPEAIITIIVNVSKGILIISWAILGYMSKSQFDEKEEKQIKELQKEIEKVHNKINNEND